MTPEFHRLSVHRKVYVLIYVESLLSPLTKGDGTKKIPCTYLKWSRAESRLWDTASRHMLRLTRMEAIFSGVHVAGASWRRRIMWKLQVRLKKQTTLRRKNLYMSVNLFGVNRKTPPPRRRHQPSTTSFVKAKLNNQGVSSLPSPCCLAQSCLISHVTWTTGIKYMKTTVIFWACCTQTKKII